MIRALVLLAALIATPAPAAEGPVEPYETPALETLSLDNGFKAEWARVSGPPLATLTLTIRAGRINEGDAGGLASLVAEALRVSGGAPASQPLARQLARMGGTLEVESGMHQTVFRATVLSDHAPEAVLLLSDLVQAPPINAEAFEAVKADAITEAERARRQPAALAEAAFLRTVFDDSHPYGRVLNDPERLRELNVFDARAFHQRNYGAARARLTVLGRFDSASIEDAARTAFEGWRAGAEPLIVPAEPGQTPRLVFVETPDAGRPSVWIGARMGGPDHPDHAALEVANAILAGYFGGRLTEEADGARAEIVSDIRYLHQDGYWRLSARPAPDDAVGLILHTLKAITEIRDAPPSKKEVQRAARFLAGLSVLRQSTRAGLAERLTFIRLHDLDEAYVADYVESVQAVEPREAAQAAGRAWPDEALVIVVAGPAELGERLTEIEIETGLSLETLSAEAF